MDIASGLGRKANLSDYYIGSFLIGIGTSLPELFTSIAASISGSPELVTPTVFGTIIANLGAGFGLGVLALFFFVRTRNNRFHVFTRTHALSDGFLNFESVSRSPVIFAAASVLFTLILCLDGVFGRYDAGIFILLYAIFFGLEIRRSRTHAPVVLHPPTRQELNQSGPDRSRLRKARFEIVGASAVSIAIVILLVIQGLSEVGAADSIHYVFLAGLLLICGFQFWDYSPELRQTGGEESTNVASFPALIGVILLGIIITFLFFSGIIVVESIDALAIDLGISSGAIAASALAIGTSLPDIVVALNVTRRGRHNLLIGHIFQSNVFDVFLIMAVCGLIVPLPDVATGSSILSILAAILLTIPLLWTLRAKRLTALGGLGLFLGFLVFLGLLF